MEKTSAKKEKKPAVKRVRKPKIEKEPIRQPAEEAVLEVEKKEPETVEVIAEDILSIDDKSNKPARYYEAIGRRKTAVARVRLFTQGEKNMTVNGKPYKEYFLSPELQKTALSALEKMKCLDHFRITINVSGGGINGQAEAIRHGITRALVEFNADFRKRLRRAGYLTRDPRARERKKFGLKRARRAPQWAKR